MYEIKPLQVLKEGDPLLASLAMLVPESLHCCLYGRDPDDLPDTSVIAFIATFQGVPVGIGLANFHLILKSFHVHHLFIKQEHRSQHLGRRLFMKMQQTAKQEGGSIFTMLYTHESPFVPAIEKILHAAHWKGVRLFMIRCLYDVSHFDMPWIHTDYRYSSGFSEFPWHELTEEDRKLIQKQLKQGVIPYSVSPFQDENKIEKINSLGLRYQGEVVGWIITHRIDLQTIKYKALFIQPAFHFTGNAMKLLFDSILLHLSQKTAWAILEIPILRVHPAWIRFAKHRLIPFADQVTHLMQAWDV